MINERNLPRTKVQKIKRSLNSVADLEEFLNHTARTSESILALQTFNGFVYCSQQLYFNLGTSMLTFQDGDFGGYVDLVPVNHFWLGIKKIKYESRY